MHSLTPLYQIVLTYSTRRTWYVHHVENNVSLEFAVSYELTPMFGVCQVAPCPNHHFLTSPQTIKNQSSLTAAAFVEEIVALEFIAHGVVVLAGCKVDGDAPPPLR